MGSEDHFTNATQRHEQSRFFVEDQLHEKYGIETNNESWKEAVKQMVRRKCVCSRDKMKSLMWSFVPITQWLPKYKFKEYLLADIIAGLTIGIVHLPQGMAYGLLASLPAVAGLYVSFFPVLVYLLLGTSRHMSIGTFAVLSLMISQVVNQHVVPCRVNANGHGTTTQAASTLAFIETSTTAVNQCEAQNTKRKMEIAVALALISGLIQIVMSLLRLGIVATYLSSHLVSGFTCGAAFHVLTSQVPKLLGITVKRFSDPLSLIYTYIGLFKHIRTINWATVIISLCCIVFLVVGKEINRIFRERLPIIIPWEIGIVIFGTIASHFGLFSEKYKVHIVGHIPTGIETTIPKAGDLGAVFFSAIPLVIVSYATEISLCKMFATKHSYTVDPDQELVAMGTANIVGSFFSCFPCAPSLSRSVIWDEVGAKTQLAGLFSSILVLTVLLWIGPLLESLPQAALAAIIVVNLKSLLKQFVKIPPLWRSDKLNALTWVVTWTAVFFLGVSLGLGVGVAFEAVTVLWRTQFIKGKTLGLVGETGEYRDVEKYQTEICDEHKNIVLLQFPGPIIYANKDNFNRAVSKSLGFDPSMFEKPKDKVRVGRFSQTQNKKRNPNAASSGSDSESELMRHHRNGGLQRDTDDMCPSAGDLDPGRSTKSHLILDLKYCPFVDNDGAQTIKLLHQSLQKLDIDFFIAFCNVEVRQTLKAVCEDSRPAFFISTKRAMDAASGIVGLEFDQLGRVVSTETTIEESTM